MSVDQAAETSASERLVWDTPVSVDGIDAMTLPFAGPETGPRALWDMVDAVAEAYQVPRDLPFFLILSILSTCTGGRRVARIRPNWTEQVSIYSVTALPPGTRKSPVFKAVTGPLHEVQAELRQQIAPQRDQNLAHRDVWTAKVEKLKKAGDTSMSALADLDGALMEVNSITVPALPKLVGDDVTPEHLGHTMAEQEGRFALFSSEGGIFTTLGGRYSNGVPNLDLVLKAWSGDHWDSGRVTRGDLTIENPFLSIGLTVQPEILEGLAEVKALRHSGFLGRFFYALPRSLVGIRKPDGTAIPEHVRDAYRDAVWALGHIVWPSPEAELPLTEEAVQLLDDFHEGHEPRLHPDFGDLAEMADWAAKLPGQLVRVATLLALFDQPHVDRIDATWVRQAINLAPYFISQASAAFRLMAGNTSRTARPRIVLTWIRRKHLTEFTVRDVRRGLGGQEWAKDVEEIRAALDELEDLGWVQMLPQPDTGSRAGRKPSERYAVNPAAHRPGSVNSVNESRGAA